MNENRNKKRLTDNVSVVLILFSLLLGFGVSDANAQDLDKVTKKECKKVASKLEKEGWQVYGRKCSVEESLKEHFFLVSAGGDSITVIESHSKGKNINQALRKSQHKASRQYAAMKVTQVDGSIETKMSMTQGGSSNGDGAEDEETENVSMSSHFKSETHKKVNLLSPSAVFWRTLDDHVEVLSFYVVK